MDVTVTETTQQVIQVFPEEWQPLIATIATIAFSIFGLVMFLMPFISKWASNRQIAAINEATLNPEDVALAVEAKLALYEKSRLISEIANWKYKLIYATEETRPMIEGEITRLETELQQYA